MGYAHLCEVYTYKKKSEKNRLAGKEKDVVYESNVKMINYYLFKIQLS